MKKILFALTLVGFSVAGLVIANAQYYDYYGTSNNYDNYGYGTYSDSTYYGYTDTGYSNYSYPQNYYYGGNYGYGSGYSPSYSTGYYGSGGIGSYTVGCTTYYYNTRTGAQLYTRYICNTYQYQQPTCYYTCNNSYTYPYYYGNNYGNYYGGSNYYGGTQYCTYRYVNGSWYPSCGY